MNGSFVTLHNVFPRKIRSLKLSLPDFMLILPAHVILLLRRVPHCCLPMASPWSFLQRRTPNPTGPAVANLPVPTHPTPKPTRGQDPPGA